MAERAYYSDTIEGFLSRDDLSVLGELTAASEFDVDLAQREAWQHEVRVLRDSISAFSGGYLFLEFVVPRLGKRIDAVLLLNDRLIILEFKVGATSFTRADINQVWDYALDLKNFHETSRDRSIWPVLVITGSRGKWIEGAEDAQDQVAAPTLISADQLGECLHRIVGSRLGEASTVDEGDTWQSGRYRPRLCGNSFAPTES